jgi:MarR family transcriptional regulator for hemolysin
MTAVEDRAERMGKQVAMALKGLQADLEDALSGIGSSFHTYLVLRHVEEHPGLSQRALADRLGIEGPTLTHHLDRLTAEGLVRRVRSDEDRRVSSAVLTTAGRSHLAAAVEVADACDAALRSLFSDDEWQTLGVCLRRITDRYGRHSLDHDRIRSA